jgi:hypothetical protein
VGHVPSIFQTSAVRHRRHGSLFAFAVACAEKGLLPRTAIDLRGRFVSLSGTVEIHASNAVDETPVEATVAAGNHSILGEAVWHLHPTVKRDRDQIV